MQERVYKTPVRDAGNLKQHLIDTWASVSQNIINEAVDHWRNELHTCNKAKGYHFEDLLS